MILYTDSVIVTMIHSDYVTSSDSVASTGITGDILECNILVIAKYH